MIPDAIKKIFSSSNEQPADVPPVQAGAAPEKPKEKRMAKIVDMTPDDNGLPKDEPMMEV